MASVKKRGGGYQVRWRDPDGTERSRQCPDFGTARTLAREAEQHTALGRRWEPQDAPPPARLEHLLLDTAWNEGTGEHEVVGGLIADFLEASESRLAEGTRRHYESALRRFVTFLAERNPRVRRLTVDLLTRDAVEAYFSMLVAEGGRGKPGPGLTVAAARTHVHAIRSAWEWAYDSDTYGEVVRRPRMISMPRPVGTPARAPTWAEMDATIHAAYRLAEEARKKYQPAWLWRARLVTLLRFTGLRVDEQAMQLRWDDVDLQRAEITIRGELGKSSAERAGRIIPISPHLVELMAGWGAREGYVIAPHHRDRTSRSQPLTEVWRAAGVPERVWAAGGGRGRSQVHHAYRKGFKTGLAQLKVDQDIRDFLVGHNRGIDYHYLETDDSARNAVALIPPIGEPENVNVVPLAGAGRQS